MRSIQIGRKTAVLFTTIFLIIVFSSLPVSAAPGASSNITIVAGSANVNIVRDPGVGTVTYAPNADNAQIGVENLKTDLDAGLNVVINSVTTNGTGTQRGDVTVSTAVVKSAGADADLTINAEGTVAVNANITNIGAGAITLNGNVAGVSTGTFSGIRLNGAEISSGTGNISLTGTSGDSGGNGEFADGVNIRSGVNLVTTGGNITIVGTSSRDEGVEIHNDDSQVVATGAGTVTIQGTSTATSTSGFGVFLGNGTSADVTAVDGNIVIIGNATSTEGIRIMASGEVSTSGTGGISITGSSDDKDGIYLSGSGSLITAVSGDISITGESQYVGLYSEGLDLRDGSSISSTGAGNVTLTAIAANFTRDYYSDGVLINSGPSGSLTINVDIIELVNASNMSGSGDLTIQPRTASTTIGLGGGAGTLNLDDTELGFLQNGFSSITIGKSDSGNIDINTAVFNDPLILIGATTSDAVSGTDISATSTSFDANVRPGLSPGSLVVNGDASFADNSQYTVELTGPTTTGSHDQMAVTGAVAIGSSVALSLDTTGYTTHESGEIIIIDNDGADAVTGTFNGLAEGAQTNNSGTPNFIISYMGGDGNDVVLTAANPTAVSLGSISADNKTAVLPIILIATLLLLLMGGVALRRRAV